MQGVMSVGRVGGGKMVIVWMVMMMMMTRVRGGFECAGQKGIDWNTTCVTIG